MSKRPADDNASQESKRKRYSGSTDENVAPNSRIPGPIPAMFGLTPWLPSDIPSSLPCIPKILDPELEATVFLHPGLSDPLRGYERLEWLGDAYLELIASSLIYQTFTSTPVGRCSQLREILIRNKTLAQYFREYGLESKAQLPGDLKKDISRGRGSSSDKDIIKTQADMFEAYVAAAIISDPENGMANTASWLKSLWARTIKDQIVANDKKRKMATQPNSTEQGSTKDISSHSNLSAKEKLRIEIGVKGVLVRYEDMPRMGRDRDLGLPLYTVGAYLDGWGERNKLLGTGTALGKKEAAQKAAQQALENKKLLKPYVAKKAAFMEAMEATKASEEGDTMS
ncbi:Ribonuclease 3 [Metarhizium anisopliae]|nr:Ribonuclease 3 [Metarhizium anisopliae]